jgi:signal transduction histidine kinase
MPAVCRLRWAAACSLQPAPPVIADDESREHPSYVEESRALCRQSAETTCKLALVLVPAFGVLDGVVFAEHLHVFLALRLACVALVAASLVLLRRPGAERRAVPLGALVALACGVMIDVMTLLTGRERSPYYAGNNLVLLAVALLMPWPPVWTLLTSAILVGGYAVPILVLGLEDGAMLATNLFFLVSTAIIAVVSSIVGERLRRREFEHRAALVEALRHKSEFMARMSHELRTPLHVMIGYCDILIEDALAAGAAAARPLVERVRNHGVRLHRLISECLDYAKAEAGKMQVRAEAVDVDEVLAHVTESFGPLSERKGLTLRVACTPPLPALVSDRQRLEQILTNLVGNALKFTERGGVTVEACALAAIDGVLADFGFLDGAHAPPPASIDEGLVILVRDTGIGIRESDLARLAEDFAQVDGAAAKYGGTGLGLSISRRLTAVLGGRIAVRSRFGEGTTFALVLPVAVPGARHAA